MVSLTISPSYPIGKKKLLPVPLTLCSDRLQLLVPEKEVFMPGHIIVLLYWKLTLPPGNSGHLMSLSQQAIKEKQC